MRRICSNCLMENLVGVPFCSKCGHPFLVESAFLGNNLEKVVQIYLHEVKGMLSNKIDYSSKVW
ncbi:MAG: hypothetical protein ACFFAE_16675 [Candidatus Hodarchaeota archaeon]